ncbi:unnamed protein product [Paramecium primaurelia]|uniref:Uncharacterized protein n=1 Tax=Paramecium primaurelia TaxID=5886 RepID=A0A8S1KQ28_PARPR|nr:unnamed protein product [Paramecium primaurelia]
MEELKRTDFNNNYHSRIDTQPQQQECNQFLSNDCDFESPLKTEKSNIQIKIEKEVYTNEEMKKFQREGIFSLIGGILIHIELGTIYIWTSISPYVAAWMKIKDFLVTLNLISIIFPILVILTISVFSFGIKIAQKVGFKITIGCGSFIISLAFLIISFAQDIKVFIVIYCIMVGISGGLLFMLPIICGWRYFPNRRGLVSCFIIGGYGFGSFIFNFVCKAIVNPQNLEPSIPYKEEFILAKYFDRSVGERVPLMFQILAASYLGLSIIGTLMIRFPKDIDPDKMFATLEALESQKNKEKKYQILSLNNLSAHREGYIVTQGISIQSCILLQLIVVMSCTLGMFIINCYKQFGVENGFDDSLLTATGSIAGIMNFSLKIFWDTLTNKTSFKFTFTIISFLNLVALLILHYNTSGIGYLLIIGVISFAEGGLLVTYPVICDKIYGKQIGRLMYRKVFFMVGVSNMIGYILYAFVRKKIGWEKVYWICFAMNIVGLILVFFLKEVGYDWSDPEKIKKKSVVYIKSNLQI